MNKDEIDNIICDILQKDGPDGHIDGHEVVTSFILALMDKRADKWIEKYDKVTYWEQTEEYKRGEK